MEPAKIFFLFIISPNCLSSLHFKPVNAHAWQSANCWTHSTSPTPIHRCPSTNTTDGSQGSWPMLMPLPPFFSPFHPPTTIIVLVLNIRCPVSCCSLTVVFKCDVSTGILFIRHTRRFYAFWTVRSFQRITALSPPSLIITSHRISQSPEVIHRWR